MTLISYAQNFEDIILWRALKHVENGFYIDIGAQDPRDDSVSLLFYEKGWRGVHVEPSRHFADKLRAARPDEEVIAAVVGSASGSISFFEIGETGLSTGDPAIAQAHRDEGWEVVEVEAPSRPLSDILDQYADREIHWLKIDVEGMEAAVIQSWLPSGIRPWVVVIESTRPGSPEPNHKAWDPYLRKLGYRFVYFDGLNRFYVSDARPELKQFFGPGPNIFDGFIISGSLQYYHRLHAEMVELQFHLDERIRDAEINSNELHAARNGLVSLSTDLSSAHHEVKRREDALVGLRGEVVHLLDVLATSHEEVARREEVLLGQREEIEHLSGAMASAHDEVARREDALVALRAEAAHLSEALASAHGEVSRREEALVGLHGDVAHLTQMLEASDGEVSRREEALVGLHGDVAHLTQMLEASDGEVSRREDALVGLRGDVAHLTQMLEASDGEVSRREEALVGLHGDVAHLTQMLAASDVEVSRREEALVGLRSDVTHLTQMLAASDVEVSRREEALVGLRSDVTHLTQMLAASDVEVSRRGDALVGLRSEVAHLTQMLAASDVEVSRREEALVGLRGDNAHLTQALASAHGEVSRREEAVIGLGSEVAHLLGMLASAHGEISRREEAVSALRVEVAERDAALASSREAIAVYERRIAVLEPEVAELRVGQMSAAIAAQQAREALDLAESQARSFRQTMEAMEDMNHAFAAAVGAKDQAIAQLHLAVDHWSQHSVHLSQSLAAGEAALAAVHRSTSWKMTAPMRGAVRAVRWFARGVVAWSTFRPGSRPRRILAATLRGLFVSLRRRPVARAAARQVLRRMPPVEVRLLAFARQQQLVPTEFSLTREAGRWHLEPDATSVSRWRALLRGQRTRHEGMK